MSRTVFFNGKIYTPRGMAEALLADGQTIAAVGRNRDVLEGAEGAERIDLGGRLMLPGFIDGHMHFLAYALSLEQADLTGCRSVLEVRDRLKSFLEREKTAPGEWVCGRGWNHEHFGDPRIFT
ncbi:MAG: amidohydrolase, partial [Synergistales bacterium]|nr:amidohydrolase [Synergistales bacterium]